MARRKQFDLFGEPKRAFARNTDPSTSQDAANSVDVNYLEHVAEEAILSMGQQGANGDDVVEITGIPWQTITPRFARLIEKGRIYYRNGPDGKRLKRKGKSGRGQLLHFHISLKAW